MKIGIGFLVNAMALTPLTDGFSKALGDSQTAVFICFICYLMAGTIALIFAVILRKPIVIPRHDWFGQVFRTGLMIGAMTSLIFALFIVPLANAIDGFLIAPIVASLISVVLFKEKMDAFKFIGALLSFAGTYVILRPAGSFELGTFMALLGWLLLRVYLAATRRANTSGNAFSTLVVQCFLGSIMIAPFAFLNGVPLVTTQGLIYILALGAVSAICHFLTIAAYKRADATILAPFFYFNIVFAIPVGFLWFGEVPSRITLVGLAAITIGGVIAVLSANERMYPIQAIIGRHHK